MDEKPYKHQTIGIKFVVYSLFFYIYLRCQICYWNKVDGGTKYVIKIKIDGEEELMD